MVSLDQLREIEDAKFLKRLKIFCGSVWLIAFVPAVIEALTNNV